MATKEQILDAIENNTVLYLGIEDEQAYVSVRAYSLTMIEGKWKASVTGGMGNKLVDIGMLGINSDQAMVALAKNKMYYYDIEIKHHIRSIGYCKEKLEYYAQVINICSDDDEEKNKAHEMVKNWEEECPIK